MGRWPAWPFARAAHPSASDEALRRQCLLDASQRLRGGVFVYAIYWLIATVPTGLYRTLPVFVLGHLAGLLLIGLVRARVDAALPRWQADRLGLALALFRALPLCNGFYWGLLTAIALVWPEAAPIKHYMITIGIGMVIAGAMTMAIDPVLRLAFPVAVMAPGVVGLLAHLDLENGVFALLGAAFVGPLARLSRVVHDDYWNGVLARRELHDKALQLEVMSQTDTLTQLPNRRYFDAQLLHEWSQARRLHVPLTVAMVDLDHFKAINDRHGHPFGDHCLREVAAALRSVLKRPSDVVARYGGEEFVVLLPHTDREGARAVSRHVLDAVEAVRVNTADGQPLALSCSIGVCTLVPTADGAPHAIVQMADQALLRAKQEGRHRVVEHGGEARASASSPAMSEPASVRPHAQGAPDLTQVG